MREWRKSFKKWEISPPPSCKFEETSFPFLEPELERLLELILRALMVFRLHWIQAKGYQ